MTNKMGFRGLRHCSCNHQALLQPQHPNCPISISVVFIFPNN